MLKKLYKLPTHEFIRQNCITYYVLMTIHKEILHKVSIRNKSYNCDYNQVQKEFKEIGDILENV